MKSRSASMLTLLKSNYRAAMLLEKYNPGLLLSTTMYCLVPTLSKYINIFLSAQIINELVGLRRFRTLLILAAVTVVSNGIFSLLRAVVDRWAYAKEELTDNTMSYIRADKLFTMDFQDVDSHKTQDIISQIEENQNLLF